MPRSRKADSSAAAGDQHARSAGFEPPYVDGSPKPQMRAPRVPSMVEGKFNVEWFADSLAALNEFQVSYWNWWGRAWPEYREQVQTLMAMAETCGVDLAHYAPETLSITDIARIDDPLSLTGDQITRMVAQINGFSSVALAKLPAAKKKSWTSSLERIRAIQDLCREEIPRALLRTHPTDDEVEAWRLTWPLRFMVYCWRSDLNQSGGRVALPDTPDHLVEACMTIELAQRARDDGHDIKGALVTIPPRHGKPVHVDSLVLMASGVRKRIGDIVVGEHVISHTGQPRRVEQVHEQGILPTVRITTESGRVTRAAPDHPFLTADGWMNAGDLEPGHALACVPSPSVASDCSRKPEEYRLAGYLVGDGCVVRNGKSSYQCKITCADDVQIADIERCAAALGFETRVRASRSRAKDVTVVGAIGWIKEIGLAGKTSWTKRVPDFVFAGGEVGAANFVGAYFACDGTINARGGARSDACVEFYSVSDALCRDVQHLLLRLGIQSSLRRKNGLTAAKERHLSWRLSFSSIDAVARFRDRVPMWSVKTKRLDAWAPKRGRFDEQFIPDRVVMVENAPDGACRCLTVAVDSTFTSDDLVVHNTVFIRARRALRISRNPWSPFGVVHANEDYAADRVAGVKEWFDDDGATGRRRAALFPRVRLHQRLSKAKSAMVVTLDGEVSCPYQEGNYGGYGIHSTVQGITLHEIDFDDPVDEKERRERGSRERTNAAFHQTWLSRLTGKKSFFTLISTCWHPDDITGGLTKMARSGAMSVATCNLPCGGPPDFRPLWPEAGYDARFLRGRYRTLTPPVYACIYQNNPDDVTGRKISRLVYFPSRMWRDPSARDERWTRFFEDPQTVYSLSLDPAGSSNANSNRAGMLYSAFGKLERVRPDGIHVRVPTLLFLQCWSLTLSQHGLADAVRDFYGTPGTRVDRILVESTGGFHATAEEIVRRGVPASKVCAITPGQGTKVARLMRYALYIESGDAMFPGEDTIDEQGNPILSYGPDWERTVDQILLAGMSDDDEMLDVIRQQLGEVAHELVAAHGWDKAERTFAPSGDPQARAMHEFYRSLTKPRPARGERTPGTAFGSFSTRKVLSAG